MEVTRTQRPDHVVVKLKGRLDAAWSDHVGQALAECVRSGQHTIAVDMAEVDYISSAGIRVLIVWARRLQSIEGRLTVTNASRTVLEVLELAGLERLLQRDQAEEVTATPTPPEAAPRAVSLPLAGARATVFDLDPAAVLRPRWLGEPEPWLAGSTPDVGSVVELPASTIAVGLGALGSADADPMERLGELLAAGGVAVCQPADGTGKPDYLLAQAALTPAARLAYGIVAEGGFAKLLRFDQGDEVPGLPLSVVVQACLDSSGADAVGIVGLAETAALVGAALTQRPPATDDPTSLLAFPEVRNWVSFTAEAAFVTSVSLIVGFAARGEPGRERPLLKPLVRGGELVGHFHAAALPYRPLRKGKVGLQESVRPLFDTENVLGVLHLLNDWRDASGAGESRFLRGGCWFAPLEDDGR